MILENLHIPNKSKYKNINIEETKPSCYLFLLRGCVTKNIQIRVTISLDEWFCIKVRWFPACCGLGIICTEGTIKNNLLLFKNILIKIKKKLYYNRLAFKKNDPNIEEIKKIRSKELRKFIYL